MTHPLDGVIRSITTAPRPGHAMGPGPYPRDVWLSLAVAPTPRAGRTWVADDPRGTFEPRPDACTADAHAPPRTVELYFARPWQPTSGRAPRGPKVEPVAPWTGEPDPALLVACAGLLAAVDSGRAPRGPMPQPRYHGRRGATVQRSAPMALPVIPELVDGADAAARREMIERVAPLLRAAGELATLLATSPPDVAARARAALGKVMAREDIG